jgi:predicted nuclease with TOPRIM domain
MSYISTILEEFPQEFQASMLKFAEALEQGLRAQVAVRREDLVALQTDVRDLTAAQQRTEGRLDRVEAIIERLAVAQERTEQRIEELAAAQQRTEQRMDRIEATVERLAAAQERTEQRVEELAAAQERTTRELHSLVTTVEKLADEHQETRRQLGGLTMTVGYQLEDLAYKALPALLRRDFDLMVQDRLRRGYVTDSRGKAHEINILGTAQRNGDTVTIVGESKAQLSKNDIDRFLRRTVEPLTGLYDTLFPVLVTYMTSEPDGEAYAHSNNVALYYSYDF